MPGFNFRYMTMKNTVIITFFFILSFASYLSIAQTPAEKKPNSIVVNEIYEDVKQDYHLSEKTLKKIIQVIITNSQESLITALLEINESSKNFEETHKAGLGEVKEELMYRIKWYKEWDKELASSDSTDETIVKAQQLLQNAAFNKVILLLKNDFINKGKKEVHKAYLAGKGYDVCLKNDSALMYYAYAAQSQPLQPNYLNDYGTMLIYEKEYDLAVKQFESALDLQDTIPIRRCKTYNRLGVALNAKGQLNEAIDSYRKALAIDTVLLNEDNEPSVPYYAYKNLAISLGKKWEYDQATSYFQKVLAVDTVIYRNKHPRVARDYNYLGTTMLRKGAYDDAISLYQKVLAINSSFFGFKHPYICLLYTSPSPRDA